MVSLYLSGLCSALLLTTMTPGFRSILIGKHHGYDWLQAIPWPTGGF